MRTAGNRYMGLGAGLGVPQSALEAVTSLDPNDYLYPQPSAAQQKAALQQLSSLGSIWMNKGSGGNAFGGNPAYKSTGPYSNIADINIQGKEPANAADRLADGHFCWYKGMPEGGLRHLFSLTRFAFSTF